LFAAADVAAAARHLLKKNSFFLSFPVDSVCNDCYVYKYRRRANAMNDDDDEIFLLVDEAYAEIQIERPDLDPDVDHEEIREMALNRISEQEGKRHDLQV